MHSYQSLWVWQQWRFIFRLQRYVHVNVPNVSLWTTQNRCSFSEMFAKGTESIFEKLSRWSKEWITAKNTEDIVRWDLKWIIHLAIFLFFQKWKKKNNKILGVYGWPKNRFTEWEISTRYTSPKYDMPGGPINGHPYSNVFIGWTFHSFSSKCFFKDFFFFDDDRLSALVVPSFWYVKAVNFYDTPYFYMKNQTTKLKKKSYQVSQKLTVPRSGLKVNKKKFLIADANLAHLFFIVKLYLNLEIIYKKKTLCESLLMTIWKVRAFGWWNTSWIYPFCPSG